MKRKPTPLELKVHQLFFEAAQRHREGNIPVAEALYRKILELDPNHFDALHMVGVIGNQTNQIEESLPYFEKARKLQPDHLGLLVNYGSTLRKTKRPEEAIKLLDRAVALHPDSEAAVYNRAQCLAFLGRNEEAARAYRHNLRLNPQHAESYVALGHLLASAGDDHEATLSFERALALNQNNIEALIGLAFLFRGKKWFTSAVCLLQHALSIEPRNANARSQLSLLLLQLGRLKEGWKSYEGRFWYAEQKVPRRPVPPVYWDGESLEDKNIYIWPEQGVGDEIFYASMIPDLCDRSGRVTLECSNRMGSVFQRSFPSVNVITSNLMAQSGAHREFHFQSSIASLGQHLRPSLTQFPQRQCYLKPDEERLAEFKRRYGPKLKVGISWRSSSPLFGAKKSSSLLDWAPILKTTGVQFVSLQYGDTAEELSLAQEEFGVEIIQDSDVNQLKDMDTFFAQVGAMDLVISTSNTSVHVSGSLGRPTWLLLPQTSGVHWYWFFDTPNTPWYPSILIHRQSNSGEWEPLISRVAENLAAWAAENIAAQ